jgi:hypothetical protein
MNENKISLKKNKSIHKDNRSSISCVINEQMNVLDTEQEKTSFLLKSMPFIKRYWEEVKQTNVSNLSETSTSFKKTRFIKTNDIVIKNTKQTRKTEISSYNDIEQFVNKSMVVKKGEIYTEFMKDCMNVIDTTNDNELTDIALFTCSVCGNDQMKYIQNEAIKICEQCGNCENYQNFDSFASHGAIESDLLSQFAYKRQNHFREWLTQIQAKESTIIPETVIIAVMKEIKKERISSVKEITNSKIKSFLKKTGFSNFYEHTPTIISKICGTPAPRISEEVEIELIDMFKQIQAPFEEFCPKNRTNFLSYSYTLYKLCQILGHNELLPLFTLLKSREKLAVQDQIWKKICHKLGWVFYPSL